MIFIRVVVIFLFLGVNDPILLVKFSFRFRQLAKMEIGSAGCRDDADPSSGPGPFSLAVMMRRTASSSSNSTFLSDTQPAWHDGASPPIYTKKKKNTAMSSSSSSSHLSLSRSCECTGLSRSPLNDDDDDDDDSSLHQGGGEDDTRQPMTAQSSPKAMLASLLPAADDGYTEDDAIRVTRSIFSKVTLAHNIGCCSACGAYRDRHPAKRRRHVQDPDESAASCEQTKKKKTSKKKKFRYENMPSSMNDGEMPMRRKDVDSDDAATVVLVASSDDDDEGDAHSSLEHVRRSASAAWKSRQDLLGVSIDERSRGEGCAAAMPHYDSVAADDRVENERRVAGCDAIGGLALLQALLVGLEPIKDFSRRPPGTISTKK